MKVEICSYREAAGWVQAAADQGKPWGCQCGGLYATRKEAEACRCDKFGYPMLKVVYFVEVEHDASR